jgi:hypothetical protein
VSLRLRSVTLATLLVATVATPALGADSDGDLLTDAFERRYGITDPNKKDTDGDGIVDSAEDNDRDRLGNLGEQKWGTNPKRRDTDRDGKKDNKEDKDRNGKSNGREQDKRRVPQTLRPTLADAKEDVSPHKGQCQTDFGRSWVRTCAFGPADGSRTVALMGDSHALQILTPVKRVTREKGWRLVTLMKKACPPIVGIHNLIQRKTDGGVTCRRWRKNAHAWLRDNPVDFIIIAHSDSYEITTYRGKRLRGFKAVSRWREGMRATMKELPRSSKVLLLGDTPENEGNPVKCLRKYPWNVSKCVTPRERKSERRIEAALRQATLNQGGAFRGIYDKVCTYDPCPVLHGDVLIWRDRGHYTETFAQTMTPTFRKVLTAVFGGPKTARKR